MSVFKVHFDNFHFFLKNFYLDREQMIRATVSEIINSWFTWLTNVLRVLKCQFSSSALSFAS